MTIPLSTKLQRADIEQSECESDIATVIDCLKDMSLDDHAFEEVYERAKSLFLTFLFPTFPLP